MLKLDNSLLDELGLGSLPEDQKRSMLQHIYETLELRVGTNLANQMSDQQLEEFEKFIDDSGDANQAQALQWLETNLPNYKQVVNDVFEALKLEVKQMAPQLVATSAQQSQMSQAAQPVALQQPMATPMPPAQPYPYPPTQQNPQPVQPMMPPQPQQPAPTGYYQTPAYPQDPQSGPQPTPQSPPAQQQDDAQIYQFPQQQPPAGPGPQQPPQYPSDQQAA